jgi:hypothetical protein
MIANPRRSFILHLLKDCPEAREALAAWQEGEYTFEQAMMETVKELFLAKQEVQRQLDYRPVQDPRPPQTSDDF